ncbi:MAG: ABC transporter permease subunit [Desulfovibrio sp.]|jgi:NitT/TauT family transport system permease protein|nr:ABC transporter permease subunit [Desulfovibrio sp.]
MPFESNDGARRSRNPDGRPHSPPLLFARPGQGREALPVEPPAGAPPAQAPVLWLDAEYGFTKAGSLPDLRVHLSVFERLRQVTAVRKGCIVLLLALIWQIYAALLDNGLMFPTFSSALLALYEAAAQGELLRAVGTSLRVLAAAYAAGVVAAGLLTVFALTTRLGCDFLETCTGMFNLLPAIALLPLALLWFGLGYPSIMFVIVHSVTWPMTLNIYSGFTGVSGTLRMVGKNYELSPPAFLFRILIPAALPQILTGLRVGWAFSWRTLIASELVFGVSSGSGGIGWFIYEKKNQLDIASVFAGLITIIIIGLLVENLLFNTLEAKTIRRWGMK